MMAAAMGAFGKRMQREREMRGIKLEEISESTKITTRCLKALEEEEFDKLPGGIFNKGFVRSYAAYLGIDEDEAVADFVEACGGEKEQPLPDPPVPRAVVLGQRAKETANWRTVTLLVVLLATAVAAVWKGIPAVVHEVSAVVTARLQREPTRENPAPLATTAPSTETTPAPAETKQAPPPEIKPPVEIKPRAEVKPQRVAKVKPVAAVAAPAPAPPPVARPSPAAAVPAGFVVHVRATQDAWVQIVADGKLFSEGVLIPPAEKRVQAAKEVVLKTGNAAGVEVSFNGQPLPSLGDQNQMATVTFTAAGVQR